MKDIDTIQTNGLNLQRENKMNKCHVCASTEFHHDFVDEIFYISGKPVLVEHIPTEICNQCGEETFSRQTTEQIRLMLYSQAQPVRAIAVDVFAFA
jgi:HTH-type transcriptional regulator / antitoxin MqsA